ncbi:MAG: hypothetical protein ACI8QZ_001570 [Chlamydiales bacterium]|jgi:hypothetical protein
MNSNHRKRALAGKRSLGRASLDRANLKGADLSGADLTEADLSRVNFVDALGADGPDLREARLHDVRITTEQEGGSSGAFLELAMVASLDQANFGNALYLTEYLSRALPFALERQRSAGAVRASKPRPRAMPSLAFTPSARCTRTFSPRPNSWCSSS